MMKKIQLITFLLICNVSVFAQSDVEIAIQLFQADVVSEAEIEVESFGSWLQPINEELETFLADEKGDKEVAVFVSLYPKQKTKFQVASRPEMPEKRRKKLIELLQKKPTLHSNFMPYSFAILVTVNKGCEDEEMDYSHPLVFPEEEWTSDFIKVDLAEKQKMLQDWAKNGLIPLLANFETKVDEVFKGVQGVGTLLEEQTFLEKNVVEITEQNPTYWRGVMEMELGNQLIPFSKVCMHIANGEFDQADLLLSMIQFFDKEGTLSSNFYTMVKERIDIFHDAIGEEIQKGIELHDKGEYKAALDVYNELYKICPNSTWLNYEIYLSTALMVGEDKAGEIWEASKPKIYANNPMYGMMARASNGAEGYELYRRQEINGLFQSREKIRADLVAYADIALDVKAYGFAAQMYWYVFSYLEKDVYDNRNILAHYLYCLDKLGDVESAKNFKGDFQKEFKKIEKERRELMENSSIYQSMED